MNKTELHDARSDTGLFGRLFRRARENKFLTVVAIVLVGVAIVSAMMAITDSEDSESLLVVLFVLLTIGLFCTLGVIFDALDEN